ncbi:transcriptional regulator swi6 [Tulasnella sp. 418]|nr:transcriptional regulator swi6 [Tulasnella sp. 418]
MTTPAPVLAVQAPSTAGAPGAGPSSTPGTAAPATGNNPRVYNAIYSSVQVYECMVRGIAVMRRRLDSYVNATQILKVAGIDKGRRTKILEKEILPGRHEIVQGGYGKYQGTWIPLERGREVATQFGVLPLLAPLFDYVPVQASIGNLPTIRAPHALYGFGAYPSYLAPGQPLTVAYASPGAALTMLQQGRAQGFFGPGLAPQLQQQQILLQQQPLGQPLPPGLQHLQLQQTLQQPQPLQILQQQQQQQQPQQQLQPGQLIQPNLLTQPLQLAQFPHISLPILTNESTPRPQSVSPALLPTAPAAITPSVATQDEPQAGQKRQRDLSSPDVSMDVTPTIMDESVIPQPQETPSGPSNKRPRLTPPTPTQPAATSTQASAPEESIADATTPEVVDPIPSQTVVALSQEPQPASPAIDPALADIPIPEISIPPAKTVTAASSPQIRDVTPAPPPSTSTPSQPETIPPSSMQVIESTKSNSMVMDLPEPKTRFSTKPSASRFSPGGTQDKQAPLKSAATRAVLLAIYNDEDPGSILEMLTAASPPEGLDVDLVLDDQGHTALHWASALARVSTAEILINTSADIHRGNFAGETPLIRAVLATNNFEHQSFDEVLTLLQPSLMTVDSSSRSVLHHIAHVAGVKGRAPSARYYMETVLERLVRHKEEFGGSPTELIDLQDVHGDTALNISARVGNRALVRMLVDLGANRILGNKLGLRPGDFGVEGENLKAPHAEDLISSLRKGPSPPVQKSQDVIAGMGIINFCNLKPLSNFIYCSDLTSMIQNLNSEFSTELKAKQDSLDVTQAHLRAATRELAEQRRQIQQWQSSLGQLDQVRQRIKNIEKVLKEEDSFDWTGRTEIDGTPSAEKPFEYRGPSSTLSGLGLGLGGKNGFSMSEFSVPLEVDPTIPPGDPISTLVKLKRLKMWQERVDQLMEKRIEGIKGASAEKELMCRRVVSLCTDVPIDKVDSVSACTLKMGAMTLS